MSAKSATAGLGETETVANLVTSAMNAYGAENLSAAQATDILLAAVKEGKAEAPELVDSLGQVLPIASQMGVSFDEVSAAIAAMTVTGTNAASASTQLKGILASLLKPSKEASDQMAELGLSAGGIRQQLREEGLLSTLESLRTAFGDNEEAVAKVFGNIRALSGVLDLTGANIEGTRAIFDSLTNSTGLLDTAFQGTTETMQFKFDKARVQIQEGFIKLGGILLPVIAEVVDVLNESLIPALEPLIPLIGEFLTHAIEGVAPHLPKLAELFGRVVSVAIKLLDVLMPLIDPLLDIGMILLDLGLNVIEPLIPTIEGIVEALTPFLEIVVMILEPLSKFIGFIGKLAGLGFNAMFGELGRWLGGALNTKSVDDFIITKQGQLLETSPDDTIIGTKTPGMMGGGSNDIYLTIEGNVYGTDPDDIADALMRELKMRIGV
jgi:TP901 family phage tail tape measure protein